MKGNYIQCMELKDVNIDEIKKNSGIKKGAPGPDNIPAGVIKHVLDVLAFPLTYRKWQDYVYIQCEYKSTKQKIKHLLREENKVKENKIS